MDSEWPNSKWAKVIEFFSASKVPGCEIDHKGIKIKDISVHWIDE